MVANLGTKEPLPFPQVRDYRLGPGTANFTHGPAMSRDTAIRALETGIGLAEELHADGVGLSALARWASVTLPPPAPSPRC